MMKPVSTFLLILLMIGCKKDKPDGDRAILEGSWTWVKTKTEQTDYTINISYKTPSTENVNYTIEFLNKGCIVYYKNSKKTDRKRLVILNFEKTGSDTWMYEIHPDNKPKFQFKGSILDSDTDTLIIESGFPYEDIVGGLSTGRSNVRMTNYFVRK